MRIIGYYSSIYFVIVLFMGFFFFMNIFTALFINKFIDSSNAQNLLNENNSENKSFYQKVTNLKEMIRKSVTRLNSYKGNLLKSAKSTFYRKKKKESKKLDEIKFDIKETHSIKNFFSISPQENSGKFSSSKAFEEFNVQNDNIVEDLMSNNSKKNIKKTVTFNSNDNDRIDKKANSIINFDSHSKKMFSVKSLDQNKSITEFFYQRKLNQNYLLKKNLKRINWFLF